MRWRRIPMRTDHVETLCDGIFAIVMTLLVLDLSVPAVTDESELISNLSAMWPKLMSYVISFIVLGVLWSFHHRLLDWVSRCDGCFLWMNICFFMVVAFVPFTTALLSEYRHSWVTICIYGINSITSFTLLFTQCWYATADNRLISESVEASSIRQLKAILAAGALAGAAAIAVSVINTNASIFVFATVYAALVVFVVTRGYFAVPGVRTATDHDGKCS